MLKDDTHPIMLRVTENRRPKYISLGYYASQDQWDLKRQRPNKKHPNRLELEMLINKRILETERMALAGELNDQLVSPDELLQEVKARRTTTSFVEYGYEYCQQLKLQGRIKTSSLYKEAILRLTNALRKTDFSFHEINVSLLNKFESELMKDRVTENSISVYMRGLRAVYNKGVAEGVVMNIDSPFKVYKVSKLNNKTVKRAISKDQVKSISDLELKMGSTIDFARKIFLFSYYTRGMNFKDIALLTYDSVEDSRINFVRCKTGQNFSVKILPPAQEILDVMRLIPNTGNHMFPILSEFHNTPQRIENRVKKVLKQVNYDLKEIAKLAAIKVPLTTYVARHTYATVLKKSGISTSIISEGMGHATEAITQTYLASFDNSVIDEADLMLL